MTTITFPDMTTDDWRRSARNVLAWVMHLRIVTKDVPAHLRGKYYKDVWRDYLIDARTRNANARNAANLTG